MFRYRSLIAAIACIALVSGSATALADPGNGKGQGNAKGNPQNSQEHGNQGHKGKNSGGDDWDHGPSINRGSVLGIVDGYRDY